MHYSEMLRSVLLSISKINISEVIIRKQHFLTNAYRCQEAWESRLSSSLLQKVNLEDFYNQLDQNFSSKGVISAIDVDIYANSVKDASYLEEMRDLLHKLRKSAETGHTLDSTHHAAVRNYLEFGNYQELIDVLKDPLNYGLFLDDYTANILLDKLLNIKEYDKAASIASLIMLQEDFSNEITCSLCQFACYKYLKELPSKPAPVPDKVVESGPPKKVEEIKVRVKFLRNPYFDDHFDLTDPILLAGKSLAFISGSRTDVHNLNLELLGWLTYQKFDNLSECAQSLVKSGSPKVYTEVLELLSSALTSENFPSEALNVTESILQLLNKLPKYEISLEESLQVAIENAINKKQKNDIDKQIELFKSWSEIRQTKLQEQVNRLDRAKRIQLIEEKQKSLKIEEQKLWFFENEEKLDLEIEGIEVKAVEAVPGKKKEVQKDDDNYIPPEILPKRK